MKHYSGMVGETPQAVAESLARQLIEDIRSALVQRDVARVVFSTGATPVQTYSLLRSQYRNALAWERVRIVQLDEYSALGDNDPRRFSTFLRRKLVEPLGARFSALTGAETDEDLAAFDADLSAEGGLDLVLFGIGINGHLGFNEPGSCFDSVSRRVELHASTRERIDAQFAAAPRRAVTMGLAVLRAARRVRVVALGAAKRSALQRGLLEAPGTDSPLSCLQSHPDVRYFVDAPAAPVDLVLKL